MIRKIKAILEWAAFMIVWSIGFGIPSFVLFPIAYIFKERIWDAQNEGLKWYQFITWYFYILLGNEEDNFYGVDWWREAHGYDLSNDWDRFMCAYRYTGIRNYAWGLHDYWHPESGHKVMVSQRGGLTKNGQPVGVTEWADIKMVNSLGQFKDNTSQYISIKYSVLGKNWVWYEVNGRLHFRGGYAGNPFGKWWLEFNIGMQDWNGKAWFVLSLVNKRNEVYEQL